MKLRISTFILHKQPRVIKVLRVQIKPRSLRRVKPFNLKRYARVCAFKESPDDLLQQTIAKIRESRDYSFLFPIDHDIKIKSQPEMIKVLLLHVPTKPRSLRTFKPFNFERYASLSKFKESQRQKLSPEVSQQKPPEIGDSKDYSFLPAGLIDEIQSQQRAIKDIRVQNNDIRLSSSRPQLEEKQKKRCLRSKDAHIYRRLAELQQKIAMIRYSRDYSFLFAADHNDDITANKHQWTL